MPDLQSSVDLCTYCPRLCSHACPVSLVEARETVTPQAKMASFGALRRIAVPIEYPELALPLYACTGCGACTEVCLYKVEPGVVLLQGRAVADAGGAAHPRLGDLPRQHREQARRAAERVQAAVPTERLSAGSTLTYLPSCEFDRDGRGETAPEKDDDPGIRDPGEEARAALRVFDRLALDARRNDEALPLLTLALLSVGCGGYPLFAAGLAERFRLHAENLARELQGHSTVIMGCAPCTWLLRTQYRAAGAPLRPKILHVTEFLAPLAEALPVHRQMPAAAYHDSCYLGRHLQVYDEPRRLMDRAVAVVTEFTHHRADARCCGGGGLLPLTAPATSQGIAAERLGELGVLGPSVVISGCATCQRQFSLAGRSRGVRSIGLLDLLDEVTRKGPERTNQGSSPPACED